MSIADWLDNLIYAHLDNAAYVFCRQAEPELTHAPALSLAQSSTIPLLVGPSTVICSMGVREVSHAETPCGSGSAAI